MMIITTQTVFIVIMLVVEVEKIVYFLKTVYGFNLLNTNGFIKIKTHDLDKSLCYHLKELN